MNLFVKKLIAGAAVGIAVFTGAYAAYAATGDPSSETSDTSSDGDTSSGVSDSAPQTSSGSESETGSVPELPPVTISRDKVKIEYEKTDYSGSPQKPKISVSDGERELHEGEDFTVAYPDDCVNVGRKTVTVTAAGKNSGSVEITYEITPLDCSESRSGVKIMVADCVYNGLAQTPDVTVKVGELTLGEKDFQVTFTNNINASDESSPAVCDIEFQGNFSGSRRVEFTIEKAPSSDVYMEIKVKPLTPFVMGLSTIKPTGSLFGIPEFYSEDFTADGQPKIAFNELRFTLSDDVYNDTEIDIPVTNVRNHEDFMMSFIVTPAEKEIPKLTINSIYKPYDGKEIPEDILSTNGSCAEVNGEKISGEWLVWDSFPVDPCERTIFTATFYPDDIEKYEYVDGMFSVTVSRRPITLRISARKDSIKLGDKALIKVFGLPEGAKMRLESSGTGEAGFSVTEITEGGSAVREFEAEFPYNDAIYTFRAVFDGDEYTAAASCECTVKVGNPKLPEEEKPETVTSDEELKALIENAENGAEISAEGMKMVSAELVAAMKEKDLKLRMKLGESYTWVIDTSEISGSSSLNLSVTSAAVPFVLTEKLGGERGACFNTFALNLGKGAKIRVPVSPESEELKKTDRLFANLFLYNNLGELEFVSCAEVSNGAAELGIFKQGKYVVIIDTVTKLVGDADYNCKVDIDDALQILILYLRKLGEKLEPNDYPNYDYDGNGIIDIDDATKVLVQYLRSI